MDKLRPCPFCGGEDIEIVFCDPGCCDNARFISCECGAELNVDCSESKAIEKWNNRINGGKNE